MKTVITILAVLVCALVTVVIRVYWMYKKHKKDAAYYKDLLDKQNKMYSRLKNQTKDKTTV